MKNQAKVVITNDELEQDYRVGVLKHKGHNVALYEDEDKGLVFYRNSRKVYFMDMLEESDYEQVTNAICDVLFTESETKTLKVTVSM